MNASTLADPTPACNSPAHLTTTLDHAQAMLDHLRAQPAGYGHELARAMLASAATYLREVFGQQHALQVVADIVGPVVEAGEVAPPPAVAPAVTLH